MRTVQVLLLQKTYSRPYSEAIWAKEWSTDKTKLNSSTQDSSSQAGTAIVLNHSNLESGPTRIDYDGRVIAAEIRH